MAATFASTGTHRFISILPKVFTDDLGMVTESDVVIALSIARNGRGTAYTAILKAYRGKIDCYGWEC